MSPEEKKAFFNTRFSIRGNIHYTRALFTPQANKEQLKTNPNAPKKYSTVLSWNPQDQANAQTLQAMQAFMARAKQMFNPNVPDQYYVWPIKRYATYRRQDGKEAPQFLLGKDWINLSSGEKFKPKVVDTNKADIIDESVVFSGVNAIVSFSFYDMGAGNSTSKKGLGVNIIAVMVLGGGAPDPIGEFNVNLDEVFGNFQDMSAPVQGGYGQPAPAPQQQQYAPPAQQQYQAPPQQNNYGQQGQYQAPPQQGQPQYQQPYPAQPQAPQAPQQPQYAPAPQQQQYAPPAPQQGQGQQPQYQPPGQPNNGWQY